MKNPEMIKLTPEEAEGLFRELRSSNLSEKSKELLISGLQCLFWITTAYQEKKHQLFRFFKTVFGPKTERVKGQKAKENLNNKPNENSSGDVDPTPNDETKDPDSKESSNDSKGHGHRSADDFQKALIIEIPLTNMKAGDNCSKCLKGIVYTYPPGKLLFLMGQAPITAVQLVVEAVRCSTCGMIFKPTLPKIIATNSRASEEAKALAALFKYKGGMPFTRFEMLQDNVGTRISKSEIWEMVEDVAESAMPIYSEFCKEAAKSETITVDDTTMPILELMSENKAKKTLKEEQSKSTDNPKNASKNDDRTGMFTTAILTEGLEHNITLYFTGRNHAGENLGNLLDKRPKGLPIVIEVCDALSRNNPKNHETSQGYCNAHNRRNFFDLLSLWPKEAMQILDWYSSVFYHEKIAIKEKMNDEMRLKLHQEKSTPFMEKIKKFCDNLLDSKKVEPNDVFGKSIAYQNKHWSGLTLFLRIPGVPLTTNSAERALKSVIRNRKNALFFKTKWGALVGDVHHSIIETCIRNYVNPMDYLIACQICRYDVKKDPQLWLPWNFSNNPVYIKAKTERDAALEELFKKAKVKKPP